MSKLRMRNLFKSKFSRAKSTTDLTEWSKSDTKLMSAVEHGDAKKVAALLSKKTLVPTKLGPLGRSVFHMACAHGNGTIVDLLLKHTEDVNDTTIQGNTALQLAAAKGHTYTVERLVQSAADVNQCDSNDMTALHHACAGRHIDTVKVLLNGFANPHATEKGGKTPLFFSAHQGSEEMCRCLLDKGAKINCQDSSNVTPLMIAAKEGHRHVCEFLLRRGALPNMVDREGHSAINYAMAAGHNHLREVFERAPKEAFVDGSVSSSPQPSDTGSRNTESIHAQVIDTVQHLSVSELAAASNFSDDESHADIHSIHSMDDSLLAKPRISPHNNRISTSPHLEESRLPPDWAKTEKALKELKEEHEQLNDDYSTLSIENLRLRDKLQALQNKSTEGLQQAGTASVPNEVQEQLRALKAQLEEEKAKVKALEAHEQVSIKQDVLHLSSAPKSIEQVPAESWPESDEEDASGKTKGKESTGLNETQLVAMLRSQILSLRNENEQLKASVNLPNGGSAISKDEDSSTAERNEQEKMKSSKVEKTELQQEILELQGSKESQLLNGAAEHEELLQKNSDLELQVKALTQQLTSMEAELEQVKAEIPSDAQRLNALLEQSKNFEEATFDDDGFVTGMDMTKEEFLQSQNQQLRAHCTLLSEELEKLRATFDAILKAGDNLQADYDQQAIEKEALQDDLEAALKEKAEVMNENEFLLTDNNALHEDLKKLVHELEKMQEKLQIAQGENEELKRSVGVASKVGEVARLLETRDHLQAKCDEYEITITRLQHDHGILVEEVQSLNERVNQLLAEREQMSADLEMMDSMCQQLDTSQQEYSQLESDFGELVKEKEILEAALSSTTSGGDSGQEVEIRLQQAVTEKEQIEATLQELTQENNELTERVEELERQLEQAEAKNNNNDSNLNDSNNEENEKSVEALKASEEEVVRLKKQMVKLNKEIAEWERRHAETVSTYRTHLLSAVQGHMDPDVKDALYHIIELRSMEQFC